MVIYCDKRGRQVRVLDSYSYYERAEKYFVCEYLLEKKQFLISQVDFQRLFSRQQSQLSTSEKLELYFSVFAGRRDVYAKGYYNKEGKLAYIPSYYYGWKNLPAEKRTCAPLTDEVLKAHLQGKATHGIYPLYPDDTCSFLVLDFDKKDWREAVVAIRQVCKQQGLQAHVEISRSGQGAHIWFFFEERVSGHDARVFGRKILELGMQESKTVDFASFDRMFPNQDILSKGFFGNLISLPLQGQSYMEGRTVFVDENFQPFPDQWAYLQGIERINTEQLLRISKRNLQPLHSNQKLTAKLSNQLIFNKSDLSARLLYHLKRLASFSNPEFYLKQAMRQSTYNVSERLNLFEESDEELTLPRGLYEPLKKEFPNLEIQDFRRSHDGIKVEFEGQLSFRQELALSDLLTHDNGLLCAETGFGKTVLGAALIAQRKRKTIILVHNKQLLDQWIERLSQFLHFEEKEAVRYTPTGREKPIGHIGQFGGTKKWRSKLVDVVMIQSLFQQENLPAFFEDYDMMLVDECHHVTALMFEKVVAQFAGKYLYGLTATPERKNGHEPIVYQRIGEIIHQAEKEQSHFLRNLTLKFTNFGKLEPEKSHSSSFVEISDWVATDHIRNGMIASDIQHLMREGRKVLIIVNRVQQMDELVKLFDDSILSKTFMISGKSKNKERDEILEKLSSIKGAFVLLSTGKFIGEGFDLPQLDTLVLAAPLSWKNNLIQYAGRIHRYFEGKEEVRIFDYIDIHVPYLERMFQRRQVAYRKMNYQISSESKQQAFYDEKSFHPAFHADILQARNEVALICSYLQRNKLQQFISNYPKAKIKVILSTSSENFLSLKNMENEHLDVIQINEKITSNAVIIDQSLIWYGHNPMLTNLKSDEIGLLRLESEALSEELLGSIEP